MNSKIIHADVIDGLKQIDDNSVSLVFYSPPYNLKLDYGASDDNLTWDEYLQWMKGINTECERILRPGGRLAINIDLITNRQDDKDTEYVRPIHYYLCKMMKEMEMLFYMQICWTKQNAVGKDTAWGSYCSCSTPVLRRNDEPIFVWSKKQFTLPGDNELSDMTTDEFHLYTLSNWQISPETKNMCNHPAPFPEELAKRVIKLFTYRGDIVVDPFSGTGTTVTVAESLGRRWIGIDNNKKFCDFARNRVGKAKREREIFEQMNPYVKRSERLSLVKEEKRKIEIKQLKQLLFEV